MAGIVFHFLFSSLVTLCLFMISKGKAGDDAMIIGLITAEFSGSAD